MNNYVEFDIFKYTGNDIVKAVQRATEHCNSLTNAFVSTKLNKVKSKVVKNAIFILMDHMYIINNYYTISGLAQLTCNNKYWCKCDKLIEAYMMDWYNNDLVHKQIETIEKNIDETCEDGLFIKYMLNKFASNNTSSQDYKKQISILTNKINNKNAESVNFTITDEHKHHIKIKDVKSMPLDRTSYCFLQRKTNSWKIRTNIEKTYIANSVESLNDLGKIVILRAEYAKSIGFSNYFELVRHKTAGNSEDIKLLIVNLVNKIDTRYIKEITRINENIVSPKIHMHDIMYCHEKLKSKIKFTPRRVFNTMFNIMYSYFGLKVKKIIDTQPLWHQSVITYEVSNGKTILGFLYVDIMTRPNKNINVPLFIAINHRYVHRIDSTMYPTRVAMLGNYGDLDKKCVGIIETIAIAKEFGHVIHNLVCNSSCGVFFNDIEFNNIMPQIMEHIMWEESILSNLCSDMENKKIVVEQLLFTRYIDYAISLKLKCVNALFDHILHSQSQLVDMLKENPNNSMTILTNVYIQIFNTIMLSMIEIYGINQNVIVQEINGSEGLLYGNILSDILAYAIFTMIKNDNGTNFLDSVLKHNTLSNRNLLHKFISGVNKDIFDTYINELIDYKEIDTEMNIHINNVAGNETETNIVTNYFVD